MDLSALNCITDIGNVVVSMGHGLYLLCKTSNELFTVSNADTFKQIDRA